MAIWDNPVFVKEIKTKLRGRQGVSVQRGVAIGVVLFVAWCYYEALSYLLRNPGPNTATDCWVGSIVVQAILIWLLSPALAANAITQEKEQQTWEMMVSTLLTPAQVLYGKLTARLVPIVAIIAAFLPFTLICLSGSTVAFSRFLVAYALFAVWIVFLGTAGLFMSWAFRRSAAAMTMSYLVLFSLTIGTALVNSIFSLASSTHEFMESPVWWLNPVRIVSGLIDQRDDLMAVPVILFSSIVYVAVAAFLLWRMTVRFRAFAAD